jgi:hypothetical protein
MGWLLRFPEWGYLIYGHISILCMRAANHSWY